LHHLHHPDGNLYRGHLGPISVPAELNGIVTGVFGLDERPVARPYFRKHPWEKFHDFGVVAPRGSFTPPQLAKLYDFPDADGTGQTIALIELGGGFKPADIRRYFAELGIPQPEVVSVSVDGGRNKPDGFNGADGEVMLDICVAGAVAPRAKIVVYFAPNTDRGYVDAFATALYDRVHRPSVIVACWGSDEKNYTAAAINQTDTIASAGRTFGVTFIVASGDAGSSDGDAGTNVDFPASSPNFLAVGGTTLKASGGAIASEVVWNDGAEGGATGGGFSAKFPVPYYQKYNHSGRGVPDVCADASPTSGYYVRVDGQDTVIGGTSAAAPLWGALIALCNEKNGQRAGFVNGALSKHPEAFHDITSGENGAYSAGPGWDACTGMGSPKGKAVCAALKR
jgi:kumamolisin